MARITEEASATVSMNMEPARKALNEATAAARQFKRELEELEAIPDGKKSLDEKLRIEELKDLLTLSTKEIDKAKAKLETFQNTMKNLKTSSFNDLYKASKELESQIRKLKPGTEEYIAASHDLKQVRTRLNDLKEGWKAVTVETEKTIKATKESESVLDGLSKKFQKYWSMFDVTIRTITGVSMKFRQCAEDAAKLDDVYSDVMKTTTLLHEEVEGLDNELMKIDTRTAREQLLLLARDAGKVGVKGTENILGFVRAADKINVALGEDLGEGAIRNLAKISDVLGYTKSMGIEKALLSIGSAVNAVGQASTAAESYLVDFTQRMAGVGNLANLSAANIIGFASGLDQSAMRVEMSSTAFQKFMMKLYSEPEKFAQYANKSVSEFADLMRTDANAAIIEVLKGLREIGDMSELTKHFDEMNLDGARTVQVLGAMAANLDAVIEAQALANEEFEKATSIDEEYATKNNNLQAQLEKARKEFHNASTALGQSLNPIMLKSTKATTYLIKALANYGKEIKIVLIVIAALTVALKAKVIWMKVVATWNATLRTGSLALAAAQALLAGNVTRAAAAWRLMNTAMKASVFGLVTAAIAGLIIVIQRLNKKREESNLLQQKSLELDKKIETAGEKEIAQVKHLSNVVHDQMRSYYERNKALEELKKLVPEYQASLTKEGELINDNTAALDNYIQKIKQAALEKLLADEIADLSQREVEAQMAKEGHQKSLDEAKNTYSGDAYMGHTANEGMVTVMEEMLAADEVVLNGIAEERKQLTDKLQRMIDSGDLIVDSGGGTGGSGGDSNKTDINKQLFQKALQEAEIRQRAEENALKQRYLNEKMATEKYEEELRNIKYKYLEEKLNLAKEYSQDETGYLSSMLDWEIEAQKRVDDEISRLLSERDRWMEEGEKDYRERLKKLMEEGEKVKASLLSPSEARQNELAAELARLDELHQAKILSEQEYEEAVKRLRKKYADEDLQEKLSGVAAYLQQVNTVMSEASNFVASLQSADLARAEATYQAEITAAGNSAEKKEEIEIAFEKRKLDIQKKYADAEMAINIAKTIADGALAIARAFADMPYPAAVLVSALIAATTAANVGTIIAQRNAIKSSSVNTSRSNYSSDIATGDNGKIGSRVITGYAEGGYTKGHTTLTTVGEKGVEYVIPHWMVQRNPVMVANLERYRKAGSHGRSGSMQRGFADGGFTPSTPNAGIMYDEELLAVLKELKQSNNILQQQLAQGIHADVALSELNRKQKILNKFKQKTSAL